VKGLWVFWLTMMMGIVCVQLYSPKWQQYKNNLTKHNKIEINSPIMFCILQWLVHLFISSSSSIQSDPIYVRTPWRSGAVQHKN